MKLSNNPYHITLISGVLPLAAAFFDSKLFVYFPFMLTGSAFLLLCFKNKLTVNRSGTVVAVLLWFLLFYGLGTTFTIGLGSMGLVGLVVTCVIFVQLFNVNGATLDPDKLARQLLTLYLLHVAYLFIELFLRVAGFEGLLLSMFGNAQNVMKLKDYNSASFLRFIGFPVDFFGLNGMLLGSQSAGQVMASAFIISAQWYKYSPLQGLKGWTLSGITLIAFFMAVNMSMLLTLSAVFLLMIYLTPNSRIRRVSIQLSLLLGLVAFFPAIVPLLFYRIEDFDRDVKTYSEAFGSPLGALGDANWIQLLFGHGRVSKVAEFADFGLGMLMLHIGIVPVLFCAVVLLAIIVSAYQETRHAISRRRSISTLEKKWLWLATVNALIAIVFAMGLMHYTPSIELGGLQMFAFSISVTIISTKNLRNAKLLRCRYSLFE